MTERVVIDSCVFVNVLTGGGNDDPEWIAHSRRLLRAVDRGQVEAYVSAVAVAEVLANGKIRGDHLTGRERRERIQKAWSWLGAGKFRIVEVDRSLAVDAGHLGQDLGLRGSDALILASAVRVKASRLFSWDEDLLKVGGGLDGLRVVKPLNAVAADLLDHLPEESK